ncbi:MAG: hypothetical protein J6Z18_05450 [Prevotella sp.]|nr:hypothetical protein [Prevotella sp.]
MKKVFIMLTAVLMPLFAAADTHDNDTIVVNHPQQVTVITGDSLQKIIINGKEGDENFEYRNTIELVDSNYISNTEINKNTWELRDNIASVCVSGNSKSELILGGPLLIGFAAPTHKEGVGFKTFSSWEIALPFISYMYYFDKKRKTDLNFQTFFNWRNYRLEHSNRFVKSEDGHVILAPYPEGSKPKFSRVKVFSISGALLLSHRFCKEIRLSAGPMINFNTYASIKTRYNKDGVKMKEIEKNINQRKITFDWMGVIDTHEVDLYIKYSPNDVLKEGNVKFRSLTFGLYI